MKKELENDVLVSRKELDGRTCGLFRGDSHQGGWDAPKPTDCRVRAELSGDTQGSPLMNAVRNRTHRVRGRLERLAENPCPSLESELSECEVYPSFQASALGPAGLGDLVGMTVRRREEDERSFLSTHLDIYLFNNRPCSLISSWELSWRRISPEIRRSSRPWKPVIYHKINHNVFCNPVCNSHWLCNLL